MDDKSIAEKFMCFGVCEFGQSAEEKAVVTTNLLKTAGFNVEPSGFPVFGGMFPMQPIKGPDGEAAFAWLRDVLGTMRRGHFEDEVEHIVAALSKARTK
jgi:hypothetical protein